MYGVYQTYYQSSLLHTRSESDISWIGSIEGFLLMSVSIIAGPIYDAGYTWALLLSGTTLTVLGMMMTSLCSQYWEFMLAQGVTVGIGCGLLFLPSVVMVSQYFTTKLAFATGIASTGSSLGKSPTPRSLPRIILLIHNSGAVIYPVVFSQFQPRIGFPWTIRTLAFIMLFTSAISLPFMRQRLPAHAIRKPFDLAAFKERPYLFANCGVFFGFMGIYVPFFYAEIYAQSVCHTSDHVAFYLLAIINTGSIFGRLIPNFLADKTGPLNMQIGFGCVAAVLAFCWIGVRDSAGIVVWCVLYGFFSGTFVSLAGPIMVSLSPDHGTVGTRMGMALGSSGMGLLVGSPIAGTILRSHGWSGLQAWCGVLLILSNLCMLSARVAKVGHFWSAVG